MEVLARGGSSRRDYGKLVAFVLYKSSRRDISGVIRDMSEEIFGIDRPGVLLDWPLFVVPGRPGFSKTASALFLLFFIIVSRYLLFSSCNDSISN